MALASFERSDVEDLTAEGAVDLDRDRRLVERCQRDDQAAFDELYRQYQKRLFHFCLRRLHEPHEAEDAVQETFARAWKALPSFGGDRRFYPWLTVIAANYCTDILRRRSRVSPVEHLPLPLIDNGAIGAEESMIQGAEATLVLEAFANLSTRHQRVLKLREGSGWSTQQIAEAEGMAAPAMDTLLWRARQALKREFTLVSGTERLGGFAGLALASRRMWGRIVHRTPVLRALEGKGVLGPSVAIVSSALAAGTIGFTLPTGAPAAAATQHGVTNSSVQLGPEIKLPAAALKATAGVPFITPVVSAAAPKPAVVVSQVTAERDALTNGPTSDTIRYWGAPPEIAGDNDHGGVIPAFAKSLLNNTTSLLDTTTTGLNNTLKKLGQTVTALGANSALGTVTATAGSTIDAASTFLSELEHQLLLDTTTTVPTADAP